MVGAFTEIISMMVLVLKFRVSDQVSMAGVVLGSIIAAIIGIVLDLFVLGLDYKRTENLQFEDDEYNLNAIKAVLPYLSNVHVFSWSVLR